MNSMIGDALASLLSDRCGMDTVRTIEAGEPWHTLWQALVESGFADALVPDSLGGSGLSIEEVADCWVLAGRHALPVPLAETMIARALLAHSGLARPDSPIAFGNGRQGLGGAVQCSSVVCARTAGSVLVTLADDTRLLAIAEARSSACAFELDLTLEWPQSCWLAAPRLATPADLRLAQALVLSVQLAGALDQVFQRTLAWANEREQFGKPIGKFQAIQHQLSVMAEEAFAARMAARIACLPAARQPATGHGGSLPDRAVPRDAGSSGTDTPAGVLSRIDPLRVAIAKARTSEAALQVAQIAHAVHGAIGFTHEFDLQLLTRRLHAWRQAAGSESAWHDVLGRALLADSSPMSLELLRTATDIDQPALAASAG